MLEGRSKFTFFLNALVNRTPLPATQICFQTPSLERHTQLPLKSAGRNEVRATEGRKKIVERNFVRDIDGCETKAPLVLVAPEKVVVTNGDVEQVAGSDARRILIIILSSRCRDADSCRAILRRRTAS